MKNYIIFLTFTIVLTNIKCDSDGQASGAAATTDDTNDPNYIENKLKKIGEKTDQVKGFIEDIPKFLDSLHQVYKGEKDIADKIASEEAKVKTAMGVAQRKKRHILHSNHIHEGDSKHGHHIVNVDKRDAAPLEADDAQPLDMESVLKADNVNILTRDELLGHSIDYINNTLPEVKSKLVEVLESFLKSNLTSTTSAAHRFENDSDYVFPNIVPHSTLYETLQKYNESLQNEKREILKLENVILKMQNIVESALIQIYKLEDALQDDFDKHASNFVM